MSPAGVASEELHADKASLRQEMLAKRRALSRSERTRLSRRIADRLLDLEGWDRAGLVHLYVGALDGEVETREIAREAWRSGKRVACPVVEWDPPRLVHHEVRSLDELVVDARGLWQPDPASAPRIDPAGIDLVVAPGLAFDRAGNRIGFGAGFYDRFLTALDTTVVALAYSLQVLRAVPHGPHDVPVDWIVTEDETIECRSRRPNPEREGR